MLRIRRIQWLGVRNGNPREPSTSQTFEFDLKRTWVRRGTCSKGDGYRLLRTESRRRQILWAAFSETLRRLDVCEAIDAPSRRRTAAPSSLRRQIPSITVTARRRSGDRPKPRDFARKTEAAAEIHWPKSGSFTDEGERVPSGFTDGAARSGSLRNALYCMNTRSPQIIQLQPPTSQSRPSTGKSAVRHGHVNDARTHTENEHDFLRTN